MSSSGLLTLKEEYGYNSFQSLGLQRSGPVAFRDFPVKLMLSKTFYSTYSYSGSLGDSVVKNLPANTGDAGSIPGLGKIPQSRKGNPLQCSCLGKPMDRGTWQAIVC